MQSNRLYPKRATSSAVKLAVVIGCTQTIVASAQCACTIDRIGIQRRERTAPISRRNNLKSWSAAVKHEKRSASSHALDNAPQASAQLLGVYRFDYSFHVHLKMNFDHPQIKRRLHQNESFNSRQRVPTRRGAHARIAR